MTDGLALLYAHGATNSNSWDTKIILRRRKIDWTRIKTFCNGSIEKEGLSKNHVSTLPVENRPRHLGYKHLVAHA